MFWNGFHQTQLERVLKSFGIPCRIMHGCLEVHVEPQLSKGSHEVFYDDNIILHIEHGSTGEVRLFNRRTKEQILLGAYADGAAMTQDIWEKSYFDPEILLTEGPTLRVVGY